MEKTRKILIVDDEPSILKSLHSIFSKQFGSNVELATSGNEAMTILKDSKDYHIVVSDFNMPDGNGLELLQYMNNNNIKSYFILFSSAEDMKDHELHRRVIHIEKPNIQKLIDTISILP